MRKIVLAVSLLCLASTLVWAQEDASRLEEMVSGTVEIRQQTQRTESEWADEKAGLEAHYRGLKERRETLIKETAKLEREIEVQRDHVAEFERRLVESDRVRKELGASLESAVGRLDDWVREDLPFLPEERRIRLENIKEVMAGNAPPAEKLRRVMEALQIEVDYGNTVEVYQDSIEIEGETLLVDILRLGRLSIFYVTPDRKQVGHYNQLKQGWEPLPAEYRREIIRAMEMANRRRPIGLERLPIGRIVP